MRLVCSCALMATVMIGVVGCTPTPNLCVSSVDCPLDQVCFESVCRQACNANADCDPGLLCYRGVCVPERDHEDVDAGHDDAGPVDVRADHSVADSARFDAMVADGLIADSSLPDTQMPDTRIPDTQMPDTRMPDTQMPDTQMPDTLLPDTLLPDTARPDSYTPVVYSGDFEGGGLDNLEEGLGVWSASGGALHQTDLCVDGSDIMVSGGSWADFTASVRVRFDATCGAGLQQAGLLVRMQSAGNCDNLLHYGCVLDVDGDRLWIAEWDGVCRTTDGFSVNAAGLEQGRWYTIVATMTGARLDCEVLDDGNIPIADANRTDSPVSISLGSVGLATWGAQASFDDLVVVLP